MGAMDILKQHTAQLAEYFDSVQIFVTKVNPIEGERSTASLTYGAGDKFARIGVTDTWLRRQRQDLLSRDPEGS